MAGGGYPLAAGLSARPIMLAIAPRVAHVTVVHKPSDARIHHRQCRTLAAAGYEVHLLSGGVPNAWVDGIRLHPLSESKERPPLRRQVSRQLRALPSALRLRADLYHIHPYSCRRHLAVSMGVALFPPSWVIIPFATGFYENGFQWTCPPPLKLYPE